MCASAWWLASWPPFSCLALAEGRLSPLIQRGSGPFAAAQCDDTGVGRPPAYGKSGRRAPPPFGADGFLARWPLWGGLCRSPVRRSVAPLNASSPKGQQACFGCMTCGRLCTVSLTRVQAFIARSVTAFSWHKKIKR
ncbi:unnamed protein product, partial [Amoebophrya sp. A120]|eukprot:GSA120T00012981001.1